jgi:phosphohistidine phosphatase SixA
MSSTAARAVETAEIIAGHLDVNSFDQYPTLVSEGGLYEYQVQDVCRHINEHGKDHDVIILSTHMEFIDQFPRRWSGLHDWEKKVPNYHGSSKATARMIDVVNQTVTYIVPKDLLR